MTKDQATRKLTANQAATKRWHSRLVRATNALSKLAKERRRLEAILDRPEPAIAPATSVAPKVKEETVLGPNFTPGELMTVKTDGLDMPVFLQRSKKQGTDEERRAMPLSGKAAMEHIIKAQSAKVTAKREKRDRAFHKKG